MHGPRSDPLEYQEVAPYLVRYLTFAQSLVDVVGIAMPSAATCKEMTFAKVMNMPKYLAKVSKQITLASLQLPFSLRIEIYTRRGYVSGRYFLEIRVSSLSKSPSN